MDHVLVQQDWTHPLSLQQQSVLLMACRGPDGMRKSHPAKAIIRTYRAVVQNAAATGEPLNAANTSGGSFMDLDLMLNPPAWQEAVKAYLYDVDEIPHHYHLHLMHGAQIIGYKHPEIHIRSCWFGFYARAVEDMHLIIENESQMDRRLSDFGRLNQAHV